MLRRNGKWVTNMGFSEYELGLFEAAMEKTGAVDRVTIVREALREYCQRRQIQAAIVVPALVKAKAKEVSEYEQVKMTQKAPEVRQLPAKRKVSAREVRQLPAKRKVS